ncbi:MAG: VCBS repeat-containing protein, partial [Colwellia sp.]
MLSCFFIVNSQAAVVGLPLVEDFSDDSLQDISLSNAKWSMTNGNASLATSLPKLPILPDATSVGSALGSEIDNRNTATAGDIDADGDIDLVVGTSSGIKLYYNDGAGNYSVTGTSFGVMADIQSLVLGDINKNGSLDIVIHLTDGNYDVYVNDGAGLFSTVSNSLPFTQEYSQNIALGDLDADGDLDLVVADSDLGFFGPNGEIFSGKNNRWFRSYGDGLFNHTSIAIGSEAQANSSVELADMDNDGDLDALFGNLDGTDALYLNDGVGNFSAVINIGSDNTNSTRDIAVGDVDNDGDLDIVSATKATNKLYLNDGTANFSAAIEISTDSEFSGSIQLSDIDNDGDLDAVFAGTQGD